MDRGERPGHLVTHASNRLVSYSTDPDGHRVALVPLWDGGTATLYAEDLAALVALGFSTSWALQPGRSQVRVAIPGHPGAKAYVARLLTEAPADTAVDYRDGDALNLRRSNLVLRPGRATSATKDALRAARERLTQTPTHNHKEAR